MSRLARFLCLRQRMRFRFLFRRRTVGMKFLEALIPAVGNRFNQKAQRRFALLEQRKVRFFALAKSGGDNFAGNLVGNPLRFLGVAFFLAGVIAALFFSGVRSDIRWRPSKRPRKRCRFGAGLSFRAGESAGL